MTQLRAWFAIVVGVAGVPDLAVMLEFATGAQASF